MDTPSYLGLCRTVQFSSVVGSTTAFDRPGEGCARPKIVRGYRPEPSDDETGLELFSDDEAEAGKQSVKQRFSPTFR